MFLVIFFNIAHFCNKFKKKQFFSVFLNILFNYLYFYGIIKLQTYQAKNRFKTEADC